MPYKQISLYYKDGSSDKVYHAQIEEAPNGAGYLLNFQYGRRGSTLTTGTRTKSPVSLELAEKEYAKIVKEKTGKGYTEGESGAVFQATSLEERFTGNVPQLLNNAKETELDTLLDDPSWLMEEKKDGQRVMLKKTDGKVVASNKKGLSILVPESVAKILEAVSYDITIDGELIGENYYIFDLLEKNGQSQKDNGVLHRKNALKEIKELTPYILEGSTDKTAKRALFAQLQATKKEGVVFKKIDSKYVPGRPASGGNQLKFKFLESATLEVVSQHKTKRSVSVAAYDGNKKVILGNVSVPVNYDIPEVGAIVEVIYMHCFTGGSLYQPKYKGVRDDQDLSDCVFSQIKFKPENSDDDDEIALDTADNLASEQEANEVIEKVATKTRKAKAK